jgi:ABC-type transport system involved in multi-copper enzyme maturation permease subunit
MTPSDFLYACRWLIRDTFRQSIANWMFGTMLAGSAVVILFCLSVRVGSGQSLVPNDDFELKAPHGAVSVAFGAWKIPLFRDGQAEVHFILLLLAEWVAGGGGTLLALVWTAGFMPDFLQPASATVLLSKPVPRWALLTGKYLGVLLFAGFQVTVFIVGTWAALGVATGYWVPRYLLGIPLLLLHFASVYSFSVLLATITRSTLACVFGSVGFWFFCWGINYGRHCLLAFQSNMPPLHPVLTGLTEIGYWIFPKPADMGMMLHQLLDAGSSFRPLPELQKVQEMGAFYPELSVLTSLAFAVALLAVATHQLSATDY